MVYEIRLFDAPVLRFRAEPDSSDPCYEVLSQKDADPNLLPLGLEPNPSSLKRWIEGRAIPRNRAYVRALLARSGLSANRPMDVIAVCKGLSLNDSYWVVPQGFEGAFADHNLYDNRLSRILAHVAFTGYGSSDRSSLASSPEFTTNGALPKCWRRIDGRIYLYKGGTVGFANAGFEPQSELYAWQVANALGADAVEYRLHRWKGTLCSACELFTSKEVGFVPIGRLVRDGGFEAVAAYYKGLGPAFEQAFSDMLALDALIFNEDRHFGNFGVLVDSRSNRIVAPAPLFDHGNALLRLAMGDDWASEEAIESYAATIMPNRYDDFVGMAKAHMTRQTRSRLRGLLEFAFARGTRYPLPIERLRLLEHLVRTQAQKLLS